MLDLRCWVVAGGCDNPMFRGRISRRAPILPRRQVRAVPPRAGRPGNILPVLCDIGRAPAAIALVVKQPSRGAKKLPARCRRVQCVAWLPARPTGLSGMPRQADTRFAGISKLDLSMAGHYDCK
jgi:hypothetical protein